MDSGEFTVSSATFSIEHEELIKITFILDYVYNGANNGA